MFTNIINAKKNAEEVTRLRVEINAYKRENTALRGKAREEREERYRIESDYRYGEKSLIQMYENKINDLKLKK